MLRASSHDVHTIALVRLFVLLLPLAFSVACGPDVTPDARAGEETVRKLDDEWSNAVGARDVEKTMVYYADDALMIPPNIPTLAGKESIRTLWKSLLEAPGFKGGWKAIKVEVARSGDLAYVTGNYELTENDDSGKAMTDKGKYLEVWKKQPDGNWKCVAHMFSSDLSAAPSAEKSAESSK